jgi:pimeloyl-ACP methyl ester carboxylesterase
MATFVLLHGSYQGGWIWQRVAGRLRAAGHLAYAPSLDGCGERGAQVRAGITVESQADEIARLLFYEDLKDVALVGTSSGGMVVCRVAELARERIGRLAFIDALALLDGEKIRDIVVRSTSTPTGDGMTAGPTREDAERRLFADLDPATRAWALARYTPHPVLVSDQPVRLDSFWSQRWPGTLVVWCRRAQNPGEAHQKRTAERLGGKWAELDTGHYPMLSQPEELTRLLLAG